MNESDTPIVDAEQMHDQHGCPVVLASTARTMERNLNAANARIAELTKLNEQQQCATQEALRRISRLALAWDCNKLGRIAGSNADFERAAQLNPAAFSSSEALRVPEPHDMDCSSRRGDGCDCQRKHQR